MKNTITLFILACAAFILLCPACKKGEKARPVLIATNAEPDNPNNPHDSFGYFHNVILDSIERKRRLTKGFSFTGSCKVILKFYQKKGWPKLDPLHFDSIPQIVINSATDITGLINRSKWSDSAKTRLQQLIRILKFSHTDSLRYPELKTRILLFEREIQESNLGDIDKELILKCSSLARFSAYRWIQRPALMKEYNQQVLLDNCRRQGINIPTIVLSRRGLFERIAKWIAVTATDIGGAIADLSVASGAASSDFMSSLMNLN